MKSNQVSAGHHMVDVLELDPDPKSASKWHLTGYMSFFAAISILDPFQPYAFNARIMRKDRQPVEFHIKVDRVEKEAKIIERPDVYLHFGHNDFDIVWNPETKRQDVVHGVDKFFGGMGEGSSFDTWQDAVHASLYDMYQCYEGFRDGDTFIAEYQGERQEYHCYGFHVIKAEKTHVVARNKYGEPVNLHGPVCSLCSQRIGIDEPYGQDSDGANVCRHCAVYR